MNNYYVLLKDAPGIDAGTKQEYYTYLREHKIGFLEAEYISRPIMLNGQLAPIIKIGTWKTQSPEILEAVKKYMKNHKKLNTTEKNSATI